MVYAVILIAIVLAGATTLLSFYAKQSEKAKYALITVAVLNVLVATFREYLVKHEKEVQSKTQQAIEIARRKVENRAQASLDSIGYKVNWLTGDLKKKPIAATSIASTINSSTGAKIQNNSGSGVIIDRSTTYATDPYKDKQQRLYDTPNFLSHSCLQIGGIGKTTAVFYLISDGGDGRVISVQDTLTRKPYEYELMIAASEEYDVSNNYRKFSHTHSFTSGNHLYFTLVCDDKKIRKGKLGFDLITVDSKGNQYQQRLRLRTQDNYCWSLKASSVASYSESL
jgi:hypothetical protein